MLIDIDIDSPEELAERRKVAVGRNRTFSDSVLLRSHLAAIQFASIGDHRDCACVQTEGQTLKDRESIEGLKRKVVGLDRLPQFRSPVASQISDKRFLGISFSHARHV